MAMDEFLPVGSGLHQPPLTSLEASSRCQSNWLKMKNILELYDSAKPVRLTQISGHPTPPAVNNRASPHPLEVSSPKTSSVPFSVVWAGNVVPYLRRRTQQMRDGGGLRRRVLPRPPFLGLLMEGWGGVILNIF